MIQKNVFHPRASTRKPQMGPEAILGIPNRLERSAYCVAENRFWVNRRSNTKNAPVPSPVVRASKPTAPKSSGRLGAEPETRT